MALPRSSEDYRLTPYPRGWYFLETSEKLKIGDVVPKHFFDRELVLFRTEDGTPHVVDAYCPHLGAHLGHGGKVVGDRIRCPFHAWEYEGKSGRCVKLANGDPIPKKARLSTWQVREANGLVLLWFHEAGAAPEFEVPPFEDFDEPGWSEWSIQEWRLRTCIQDISENDADVSHSPVMHGFTDEIPDIEMADQGAKCRWRLTAPVKLSAFGVPEPPRPLRSRIPTRFPSEIIVERWGLGMGWVRQNLNLPAGQKWRTQSIATTTPIDPEHVLVTLRHRVRRAPTRALTRVILDRYSALFNATVDEDVVIWENKIYRLRPVASKSDWAILKFRKWARQFYDPAQYDAAYAEAPVEKLHADQSAAE